MFIAVIFATAQTCKKILYPYNGSVYTNCDMSILWIYRAMQTTSKMPLKSPESSQVWHHLSKVLGRHKQVYSTKACQLFPVEADLGINRNDGQGAWRSIRGWWTHSVLVETRAFHTWSQLSKVMIVHFICNGFINELSPGMCFSCLWSVEIHSAHSPLGTLSCPPI